MFDDLHQRKYNRTTYNCLHFIVEAQQLLFGRDLSFLLEGLEQGDDGMFRLTGITKYKAFKRLRQPEDACLVFFRGAAPDDTHIGTYLGGSILHISETGVQFLPLEVTSIGFMEIVYYVYTPAA